MSDYGNSVLRPACLGMLCDTSDYNIDGACVVKEGKRVFAGVAVVVDSVTPEGYKIIRMVESANDIPYGVAMFTQLMDGVQSATNGSKAYPFYNEGSVVPVVSHGRIWTLGYSVTTTPHQKVRFNVKGYVNDAGPVFTGWKFTGGNVPYIANATRLVGVQVLQGANIVHAPPILVSGAVISSGVESPQPNDAPVSMSVLVSPSNATDATGKWSIISGGNIASIDPDAGVLSPVGGDEAGEVTIQWKANDAGGFATSFNFTFDAPEPDPEL